MNVSEVSFRHCQVTLYPCVAKERWIQALFRFPKTVFSKRLDPSTVSVSQDCLLIQNSAWKPVRGADSHLSKRCFAAKNSLDGPKQHLDARALLPPVS